MIRTRLRNKFLKNRTEENRKLYTQKRNHFILLLRKIKRGLYENINEKDVIHNKTFWKTVKTILSGKTMTQNKITLIEKNFGLAIEKKVAENLNTFSMKL